MMKIVVNNLITASKKMKLATRQIWNQTKNLENPTFLLTKFNNKFLKPMIK